MGKLNRKHIYLIAGGILLLLFFIIPSNPAAKDTEKDQQVAQVSNSQVEAIDSNNPAINSEEPGLVKVVSVVDGDTIKAFLNGETKTIRLIGVDTPETVDPRKEVQCFGKEASDKTKESLTDKMVRLEVDSTQGDQDKYGRLLRYVFLEDGTLFNNLLIEQGYAHEYTYDNPYKYQSDFKASEKSAREAQRGLWDPNTCGENTTATKYYTSSDKTSKYYYPEACDGWKSLSSSYLKSFNSLEDLLVAYPSRTLSPQCQ
ncbi:MAG: thermonuclease family protein [Candidatus Omnitrophota bacterium]|jgi:micrococcal nuclease